MSSIWTLPLDIFQQDPSEIATRLREFDLKARIYQGMGKYWAKMYALLRADKAQNELQDKAKGYTQDLYNDLLKVFGKFKNGEDYNSLNPVEKIGERFGRQAHKMVLGNEYLGNAALKEIQECLETVWEDLLDLQAGDQKGFDAMMTRFAFDTWAAMGLSATQAPSYGSGTSGSNGTATKTTDGKTAEKAPEMKLMGKGTVVYCPVVMPKSKVEAMIPSHIMTLNSTGLGLDDAHHVVIYALAKQKIDFGNGIVVDYQEVFPIIPNVSVPGLDGKLFQAIPVLWVSNITIAKGARDYWKLNKLYGKFSELVNFPLDAANGLTHCNNSVKTSVENKEGGFSEVLALSAQLEATSLATQLSKNYAPFGPIQKLLACPMIYWQGNEFYIADFALDFETSTIEGAKAKLETGTLYGMDHKKHEVDSLENSATGAFKLNYDWTFHAPQPYPSTAG